jgi:hypothetical protein
VTRQHHHEDCEECQAGRCDGTTWVDPEYPVGTGPSLWDAFFRDFSERPIAWTGVIVAQIASLLAMLRGDVEMGLLFLILSQLVARK